MPQLAPQKGGSLSLSPAEVLSKRDELADKYEDVAIDKSIAVGEEYYCRPYLVGEGVIAGFDAAHALMSEERDALHAIAKCMANEIKTFCASLDKAKLSR